MTIIIDLPPPNPPTCYCEKCAIKLDCICNRDYTNCKIHRMIEEYENRLDWLEDNTYGFEYP
jgi:hypothetical protein